LLDVEAVLAALFPALLAKSENQHYTQQELHSETNLVEALALE